MQAIPDAALDADIAIVAKKGRGKTYAAKGIVERLLAMQRRVLVLDPLSTWWGLKSSADGESAGFPVAVFGGPHADMDMTEAMARPLARIIAENNLPCVVDLGLMPKAAWQRIVRDMLDELFIRNRDPLWIVLEEADVFAPQQPREGDSAAVLGEVDRIARRGRAFGFRLISITQRPARLHKDVLTQLSTLIALGLSSPQDRDAIKAWVDGNADRDKAREVIDTLASLPVGEGWVWAPDFDMLERMLFPAITTLDTSATPKAGAKRIEPKVLAEIDLGPLRDALASQVHDTKAATPAPPEIGERSTIWNKAWAGGEAEGYKRGREEGYAAGLVDGERTGRAKERARIMTGIEAVLRAEPDAKVEVRQVEPPEPQVEAPVRKVSPGRPAVGAAATGLAPAPTAMLAALAGSHKPMHFKTAAKRAGLSLRSSSLPLHRRALISAGYAVEVSGVMTITEAGRAVAGPPPAGILDWYGRLTPGQASMLRVLAESASALTLDQISARAGVSRTSSSLGSGLSELVALGLIRRSGRGTFILSEDMRDDPKPA